MRLIGSKEHIDYNTLGLYLAQIVWRLVAAGSSVLTGLCRVRRFIEQDHSSRVLIQLSGVNVMSPVSPPI
jgi:hypothetical protein